MKSIFALWFLLGSFSYTYSSEYLHFGGTEEESRQAEYYLTVDSGPNSSPTDELTRTQRSFWKLLKNGLFGACGNCCNNCNYNAGIGNNCNTGNSLLLPFQPWRPLPLWRPLEPLFGRLNYDNFGASNYGCENSNNFGRPPSYSVNTYSDNRVNTSPNFDNNEPTGPLYETPTELPPAEPGYQLDNSSDNENNNEPSAESETPTYTNVDVPKTSQQSNDKVPQIVYQPIIYVSPQYQEPKTLNQAKQDETKYGEVYKEEQPHIPNYELVSNDEFKTMHSSTEHKSKAMDYYNYTEKTVEKETPEVEKLYSQTVPYTESPVPSLNNPLTNPSVSSVSTVYNIITPSLLHSLSTPNVPCLDGGPSKFSLYSSNYIPLDNYQSNAQVNIASLPTPSAVATVPPGSTTKLSYLQPILLSPDDQPYRACPELFKDYQRKLNTFLANVYNPN